MKVSYFGKIYTAADVFFNPTLENNFPTTNIEALACGTPVVTFNTGGSVESVGKCGEIVEKGDVENILIYFRTIKNSDNYEELKMKCIERVRKLYNQDDRFNEYIKLYTEIVKNGEKHV